MILQKTTFKGLYELEPEVFEDSRGYFMVSFNEKVLEKLTGEQLVFVQDNQSRSVKGVLRGLHFQSEPYAQTKMVRVLSGSILDVVLDLRHNEPTFGKIYSSVLSAENRKQLLVPKGFAHGFAVLSDVAEVFYKCDEYYEPGSEGGVNLLDEELGVRALLPEGEFILSDKDKALPAFREATFKFWGA